MRMQIGVLSPGAYPDPSIGIWSQLFRWTLCKEAGSLGPPLIHRGDFSTRDIGIPEGEHLDSGRAFAPAILGGLEPIEIIPPKGSLPNPRSHTVASRCRCFWEVLILKTPFLQEGPTNALAAEDGSASDALLAPKLVT